MSNPWQKSCEQLNHRAFDAIREALRECEGEGENWPSLCVLNEIAVKRRVVNTNGRAIRFVAPVDATSSAMQYETSIAATGEIPTRENFHDLFNALQWLSFPKLKDAINAGHVRLLQERGEAEARERSVPRDVLTMFDESGIIVASSDESLLQLIRDFSWRTVFVERREQVKRDVRFLLCGHGLLEKSLAPFIGITAKAILLHVDANTLDDPAALDSKAAEWLSTSENLTDARHLSPMPLLGIPGWDARSEDAAFYDNTQYFRAGYSRTREGN
jgi:Protein of unknown function (DUF3025)